MPLILIHTVFFVNRFYLEKTVFYWYFEDKESIKNNLNTVVIPAVS